VDKRFSIIGAVALRDGRLEPKDIVVLCHVGSQIGDCRMVPGEVAPLLGLSGKEVTEALRRLRAAGYVECVAVGRRPVYRINHDAVPPEHHLRMHRTEVVSRLRAA